MARHFDRQVFRPAKGPSSRESFTSNIKAEQAFTLIEVMIILLLLAGLAMLALPRIGSHQNEFKATIRKLTVLGKQLQVYSRLEHKTYRLVFDLSKKKPHSFWIESTSGYVSEDFNEEDENNIEEDNEKSPQLSTFQMEEGILPEPVLLPKPLSFQDIEVEGQMIEEGKAYIHFFPQGIIEQAAIHISDGKKANWTITYNSLTGKGHIIGRRLSLKALKREIR